MRRTKSLFPALFVALNSFTFAASLRTVFVDPFSTGVLRTESIDSVVFFPNPLARSFALVTKGFIVLAFVVIVVVVVSGTCVAGHRASFRYLFSIIGGSTAQRDSTGYFP